MPVLAYMGGSPRRVRFVGSSRRDLGEFPDGVRRDAGLALFEVQVGQMPESAKPLKGYGGAGVQEIVVGHASGTFRVVYSISLPDAVYVLHAFQKKSTSGLKTSQRDIDLIKRRLAEAQRLSAEYLSAESKERT